MESAKKNNWQDRDRGNNSRSTQNSIVIQHGKREGEWNWNVLTIKGMTTLWYGNV